MTGLLRLVCAHRVLVSDRGRLVCQTCGAELHGGDLRHGAHAVLERARR